MNHKVRVKPTPAGREHICTTCGKAIVLDTNKMRWQHALDKGSESE